MRCNSTPATAPSRLDLNADVGEIENLIGTRLIFGQETVVERALTTVLSGGHGLLVGVPGLAKTLLIHTIAQALDLAIASPGVR